MNYEETLDYLYNQLAMYQRVGSSAYKPGLDTARALDRAFGEPTKSLRCIHIAGTNGKGSTAHTIAAILQSAGYKTGLYTSPHLVDFRERIRVNGQMIAKDAVTDFTRRYLEMGLELRPSFFELTMTMAFEYFAKEGVDVAVIETGLGGRLDSTNIINPELSIITNISFDHMAMLGNTLTEIASEKAGIIKPGVPVVVGEAEGDVKDVFVKKAHETGSALRTACEENPAGGMTALEDRIIYTDTPFGTIESELTGECQPRNAATIMVAIDELRKRGIAITDEAVRLGFAKVCELTGLTGRWTKLSDKPLTICDTGHNIGGWSYIADQLGKIGGKKHIVVGFANDKDITPILKLMCGITNAKIYAAQASVPRAMESAELLKRMREAGIAECTDGGSVADAYRTARSECKDDEMIFAGGSNFVVADLLAMQDFA